MNRENLKKLADGLRGPLLIDFDMFSYVRSIDRELPVTVVGNGCGTAACACGHATYLVAPKRKGEDFESYSERLFGLNPELTNRGWDWCFSCQWTEVDNTAQGAADRIDWLLDKGLPIPDLIEGMMAGTIPLCYRTSP